MKENERDIGELSDEQVNEILRKIMIFDSEWETDYSDDCDGHHEYQMDHQIKLLQQEIEQLKADLEEANDNATWWRNRFNAVNRRLKDGDKK